MALIVQKYGGTSVGTVERIHRVADRVAQAQRDGNSIVVVLSAMSGETDRLIKLAHEVTTAPDERELDMLLSTGERVTIALLAMELRGRGINARSFTGRQVGIMTDSAHTKARIARVTADRIKEALKQGVIPIVAGFQGINEQSDVTTLGRGGSDLSAVALAAALTADRCIILPMLMVCIPQIRTLFRRQGESIGSPMKRCLKWPASERKCSKPGRSSSRPNSMSRSK